MDRINLLYFFYHLPNDENDVNNATIIQAESGYENEYKVVCNNLEEWIDKAMNAGLTLGWANSDEHFQKNVQKVNTILSKTPEKRKNYLPNTRVKTTDDVLCRGTVVKQIKTKEKHSYHGDDFVLVKYDIGKIYWSPSSKVKTITNKMDMYESFFKAPESLQNLLTLSTKESITILRRIGIYGYECYVLDDTNDDEKDLSYPIASLRHVGIFGQLPLEQSAKIILTLCNNWIKDGENELQLKRVIEIDGSEFDKKASHIKHQRFNYFEMINTMIGCLIVLIAKERIENNKTDFGNVSKDLDNVYKLLKEASDLTEFDLTYLAPNINVHSTVFTSTTLNFDYVFPSGGFDDWPKEFGLDGGYPFVL